MPVDHSPRARVRAGRHHHPAHLILSRRRPVSQRPVTPTQPHPTLAPTLTVALILGQILTLTLTVALILGQILAFAVAIGLIRFSGDGDPPVGAGRLER